LCSITSKSNFSNVSAIKVASLTGFFNGPLVYSELPITNASLFSSCEKEKEKNNCSHDIIKFTKKKLIWR